MSDQEFRNHVEALAVRRLDKPKKLSSECTKHWKEILSRQYNFDRGRDNFKLFHLWQPGLQLEAPVKPWFHLRRKHAHKRHTQGAWDEATRRILYGFPGVINPLGMLSGTL